VYRRVCPGSGASSCRRRRSSRCWTSCSGRWSCCRSRQRMSRTPPPTGSESGPSHRRTTQAPGVRGPSSWNCCYTNKAGRPYQPPRYGRPGRGVKQRPCRCLAPQYARIRPTASPEECPCTEPAGTAPENRPICPLSGRLARHTAELKRAGGTAEKRRSGTRERWCWRDLSGFTPPGTAGTRQTPPPPDGTLRLECWPFVEVHHHAGHRDAWAH
jgi:hypothetical protein